MSRTDYEFDPVPVDSVNQLIDQIRSGSPDMGDEAARRLWESYLPRLLTLARRRLVRKIRVRHDEEDLVQSTEGETRKQFWSRCRFWLPPSDYWV